MAKPRRITDFEQRFQALYAQLIADGGSEFLAQVERVFFEAAKKQFAFGTSGAESMANEYILADHNLMRRLRNECRDLPAAQRGTADTLFAFMDDLIETDSSLSSINNYLTKFEDYYLELMENPSLPEAERQISSQRYNQVTALRDQIRNQISTYKNAKKYCTHMFEGLIEGQKTFLTKEAGTAKERAWEASIREFGCSYNGMNAEDSMHAMRENVRDAEIAEMSAVIVSVEASAPDLADAFVNASSELTMAEKGFAVQNFDLAFHEGVFSKEQKKALEKEGKDIFDQIFVDGRSMNDLYASKYASSPYYIAIEQMKCEFMRDMLAGKRLDVLIPGDEIKVLPVQAHVGARSGLNEAMVQRVREVEAIEHEEHLAAEEIVASRALLDQRTKRQVQEKRERMQESQPMYSNMLSVEPSDTFKFRPPLEKERQKGRQFSIRESSGKFAVAESDSEEKRREKNVLLNEGEFLFNIMNNQMGVNNTHTIYQQMGIQSVTELYYIDGKPAHEYVQALYPDVNLKNMTPETVLLIKTEIYSAAISGKHYVEAAKIGMDEKGAFQIGVVQVQPDVRSLDGQERFYQTKPSKQMEKLFKDDKKKEERQNAIRNGFSEKLVIAATKALKERDASREAHAASYRRMSLNRDSLTKEYFDAESLNMLKGISSQASTELTRGNFGGCRTYAQLLLMARHPEVRLADLMNPDMYKQEKLEIGREVAEIFAEFHAGPNPANPEDKTYLRRTAELMKVGMEVIAGLDVKKEILYALGEPETADPKTFKEIIEKPDNLPVVNGFLRTMSALSVNSFQALRSTHKGKEVSVSGLSPEKADQYPPLYAELAGMVSPDLMSAYSAANTVTRAMNAERKWNESVTLYAKGQMDQDKYYDAIASRLVSDHIRGQIADHNTLAEISNPQELADLAFSSYTSYIAERVKKAVEAGEQDLSVGHLMKGSVSSSLTSQLIAESKMARVMKEEGKDAMWRQAAAPTASAFQGDAYFRNNDSSMYSDLGTACGLKTMDRSPSRASVARIYMMGVMGATMAETLDPANAQRRLEAGDGLTRMMQTSQLRDEMNPKERHEVARAYGDMYHNAAQSAAAVKFPKIDWKDPCSVAAVYDQLHSMKLFAIDYSQTKSKFTKEAGFIEAFGGYECQQVLDDRIDLGGHFVKAVTHVHAIPDEIIPIQINQQASGLYMLNEFASVINGRSLNDLSAQEIKHMKQIIRDVAVMDFWSGECSEDEKQKLQDYVAGKGPLPEGAKAAIQRDRENQARKREQEIQQLNTARRENERHPEAQRANLQEAQRVIEQQIQRLNQQETSPRRTSVSLQSLMDEEATEKGRNRASSLREELLKGRQKSEPQAQQRESLKAHLDNTKK